MPANRAEPAYLTALLPIVTLAWCLAAAPAAAKEYPIGKPAKQAGMEIGTVYLQPIEMDPPGMMRAAAESDIHLETDIKAVKGNPNGFADGEWVPALSLRYELVKLDSGQKAAGPMMAMVANDGPHYGDNVKLFGPGKYRLTVFVAPPGMEQHFGRHVDKETGVGPWFKPFEVSQDFVFAGIGKKGSY
jgi:periplasmic iron binding protein